MYCLFIVGPLWVTCCVKGWTINKQVWIGANCSHVVFQSTNSSVAPKTQENQFFPFWLLLSRFLCLFLSDLFFCLRFMLFDLLVNAVECTTVLGLVCCPNWAVCLYGCMMATMFTLLSNNCHIVLLYASHANIPGLQVGNYRSVNKDKQRK